MRNKRLYSVVIRSLPKTAKSIIAENCLDKESASGSSLEMPIFALMKNTAIMDKKWLKGK